MSQTLEISRQQTQAIALARQAAAGQAADQAAAASAFSRFRDEKSENTLKAHDRALATWATYLAEVTRADEVISAEHYATTPTAWHGVTWGLIEGFRQWMLGKGYAISSVNLKLTCVKSYITQAARVGIIDDSTLRLIDSVKGYHKRSIARNVDAKRDQTRIGYKKADPTSISPRQIVEQKAHYIKESKPQSLRDLVLICLLGDHGLRVSEIEILTWKAFDLEEQTFTFYRPKVDLTITHYLTRDTHKALVRYQAIYPETLPRDFALLLQTTRLKKDGTGGELKPKKLGRRAIQRRAERFGKLMGCTAPVGCHDFRHHCATQMAREGHTIRELMDWFSWTNAGTAMRYVKSAEIATRRTMR